MYGLSLTRTFNHANILNFTDSNTGKKVRPQFNSVEHMNEHMIERWNSVVKPGDSVYHLGDVVMGGDSQDWMNKHWPRLMGKKRLVVGNHDNIPMLVKGGYFGEIMLIRRFKEFGLIFSHIPIHESDLMNHHQDVWNLHNVHGHIHQNPSPKGPYTNVSVEMIDYTPVHIESLRVI